MGRCRVSVFSSNGVSFHDIAWKREFYTNIMYYCHNYGPIVISYTDTQTLCCFSVLVAFVSIIILRTSLHSSHALHIIDGNWVSEWQGLISEGGNGEGTDCSVEH